MKTNFKMKEAVNKEEAIISILDVLEENQLWLNKCQSNRFLTLRLLYRTAKKRKEYLESLDFERVRDIFIDIKTEYYNFKDNTVWS
tara:strand:- start:2209 stop:2466 length:258 start_codon:yes stop_codon:yes gene_type:complete